MAERAKKKKSPEKWLYLRNLMSFVAHFSFSFESAKECKKEGREVDGPSMYEPAWKSMRFLGSLRARLWGRWLVAKRSTYGNRVPLDAICDVDVDRLLRDPDKPATTHYRDEKAFVLKKTYTLCIRTKTEHGLKFAEMIEAYYNVQPERELQPDVTDRERRKETERARRKAWKKNAEARAELWAPRPHNVQDHYQFSPPPAACDAGAEDANADSMDNDA